MDYALGMRDVTVEFKDFKLGPLDLDLLPGRVVGLVGPNGSGKTTTIRAIAGTIDRQGGLVEVCDRPAPPETGDWKTNLGYVPDRPIFYEWLTGRRWLDLVARFYPRWDPEHALDLTERFQLDLSRKISTYSTGNRVKLALVAALAHHPSLALFDEPTAGLDPVVRTEVFDVLFQMMDQNEMTILYSTHILDDLHRLADDLIFLRQGRIQLHRDKDDLLDSWRRIRCQYSGRLPDQPEVVTSHQQGRVHELVTSDGQATSIWLTELGAEAIRPAPLTLEEIAVQIMKGAGHGRDS